MALIEACKAAGDTIEVTEGKRSNSRQNELYNQPWDGKDNDGDGRVDEADEKVTNAKAGQSMHNYGVAFDVIFVVKGKRTYDVPASKWLKIGKIGESLGLTWGGRWKDPVDQPHFQITQGYTLSQFQKNLIDWAKFD